MNIRKMKEERLIGFNYCMLTNLKTIETSTVRWKKFWLIQPMTDSQTKTWAPAYNSQPQLSKHEVFCLPTDCFYTVSPTNSCSAPLITHLGMFGRIGKNDSVYQLTATPHPNSTSGPATGCEHRILRVVLLPSRQARVPSGICPPSLSRNPSPFRENVEPKGLQNHSNLSSNLVAIISK